MENDLETNSVIYLSIKIDNKLNWKTHIDDIAIQLIRAKAMLSYAKPSEANTKLGIMLIMKF